MKVDKFCSMGNGIGWSITTSDITKLRGFNEQFLWISQMEIHFRSKILASTTSPVCLFSTEGWRESLNSTCCLFHIKYIVIPCPCYTSLLEKEKFFNFKNSMFAQLFGVKAPLSATMILVSLLFVTISNISPQQKSQPTRIVSYYHLLRVWWSCLILLFQIAWSILAILSYTTSPYCFYSIYWHLIYYLVWDNVSGLNIRKR